MDCEYDINDNSVMYMKTAFPIHEKGDVYIKTPNHIHVNHHNKLIDIHIKIMHKWEEYKLSVIDETECWSARELQKLLGYSLWQNYINVIHKAKDFAAEMTSVNVQAKDLQGEVSITQEHIDNNAAVRKMLTERGIIPENLPAAEDVKKVERLGHTGKLDEVVWNRYFGHWDQLAYDAEILIAKLKNKDLEQSLSIDLKNVPAGSDRVYEVKKRINQDFFRNTVLSS